MGKIGFWNKASRTAFGVERVGRKSKDPLSGNLKQYVMKLMRIEHV